MKGWGRGLNRGYENGVWAICQLPLMVLEKGSGRDEVRNGNPHNIVSQRRTVCLAGSFCLRGCSFRRRVKECLYTRLHPDCLPIVYVYWCWEARIGSGTGLSLLEQERKERMGGKKRSERKRTVFSFLSVSAMNVHSLSSLDGEIARREVDVSWEKAKLNGGQKWLLLLLLVPYRWGSPFWVRLLRMWPCFNPTIEVVTFRLRGWCMLGVFLLPAFTPPKHERQDLLSPCDGMHVCTD